MVEKITITLLIVVSTTLSFAQSGKFGMNQLNSDQKNQVTSFCLKNSLQTKEELKELNIPIKYETEKWVFISCTASEIESYFNNLQLSDYFVEYNPPHLLNDSTRATHHINQVHAGTGLTSSFTGKDVIVGYVDTGLDFDHPDFQNADGSTRVLRYWDHSTNSGGTLSPYGYGIVWDSTDINTAACTSTDNNAHGTTVSGAGSGNGLSTGYNQGAAPESDIIVVETNFNLPNWSLTVADACDYIFKVADSLGKPAVINLSVGNYLGSHDGNDPASEVMENLVDTQKGRIIVSACGNSGNIGKYHVHGDVDADTSFVWFNNNPSGALGPNTVYFDLWSDMTESGFNYSFKALNPAANFETRGELVYRPATLSLGTPIMDTIWNGTNRIATLEIYTSQEGDNFHMEGYISQVDSTSYKYGFYTTGTGSYDLWSGTGLGLNSIVSTLPTVGSFPSIVHYNHADSLQTIVSGWTCSEKIISVGNIKNRTSFPNLAGGTYFPSDAIPPGKVSINSSKGPNRHQVVKPDIVATGDVTLSPGPLWYLSNPANHTKIDTGGWHMGNGGTSMASPVVAGIAALFLERCSEANYQDFLNEMIGNAMGNSFTGSLPNFAYGHGLINAHDMLLNNEFTAIVDGPAGICSDSVDLSIVPSSGFLDLFDWSTGESSTMISTDQLGEYYATVFNQNGCGTMTDTLTLVQLEIPTISPITLIQAFTELGTTASDSYQWTLDGADLVGETNATLTISEPYGTYTCYTVSGDGCKVETDPFVLTLNLQEFENEVVYVYPNPTLEKIKVNSQLPIKSIRIIDELGRQFELKLIATNEFSVSHLAKGTYIVLVETELGIQQTKIVRM